MARPPRDPSLLSWPWGSAPSGSGGPSSAVGLTSLPTVNSHAESAAMLADPMVGYWCRVGSLALTHTYNDVAILVQRRNIAQHLFVIVVLCLSDVLRSRFSFRCLCCFLWHTHMRGSSREFVVRASRVVSHLHALMLCV